MKAFTADAHIAEIDATQRIKTGESDLFRNLSRLIFVASQINFGALSSE